MAATGFDNRIFLTLKQLGAEYQPLIPMLLDLVVDEKDQKHRLTAATALGEVGYHTTEIRDLLLKQAKPGSGEKDRWVREAILRCLAQWPVDAQVAALLRPLALQGDWEALEYFKNQAKQSPGDLGEVMKGRASSEQWTVNGPAKEWLNGNLPAGQRDAFVMEKLKANVNHGFYCQWAAEIKPTIPGLADWMVAAAKGGDLPAIQNLATATDARTAMDVLVPLVGQPKTALAAIKGLGRLGADAKPALELLRKAATDTNKEIANSAATAIKAIEAAPAKGN